MTRSSLEMTVLTVISRPDCNESSNIGQKFEF